MRIHHLALRTSDPEALAHFYRSLGLPERERRPNGSIWLAAGDVILMIERGEPGEPRVPEGSMEFLSFRILPEEREPFREKLQRLGVAIEDESAFTLYFRDPDGRRVGVSHFPAPAPRGIAI